MNKFGHLAGQKAKAQPWNPDHIIAFAHSYLVSLLHMTGVESLIVSVVKNGDNLSHVADGKKRDNLRVMFQAEKANKSSYQVRDYDPGEQDVVTVTRYPRAAENQAATSVLELVSNTRLDLVIYQIARYYVEHQRAVENRLRQSSTLNIQAEELLLLKELRNLLVQFLADVSGFWKDSLNVDVLENMEKKHLHVLTYVLQDVSFLNKLGYYVPSGSSPIDVIFSSDKGDRLFLFAQALNLGNMAVDVISKIAESYRDSMPETEFAMLVANLGSLCQDYVRALEELSSAIDMDDGQGTICTFSDVYVVIQSPGFSMFDQSGQYVKGGKYFASKDPNSGRRSRRKGTGTGDIVGGDKVGGDKVVGHKISYPVQNVRNINTGGGDYSEGDILKRSRIAELIESRNLLEMQLRNTNNDHLRTIYSNQINQVITQLRLLGIEIE